MSGNFVLTISMLTQSVGTAYRIQSDAKEALEKHYITFVIVTIR